MVVAPIVVLVSTPGGMVVFNCLISPSTGVIDVQWLLNGSLLDNPNLVNATVRFSQDFGVGILTIASLSSELNTTRIECSL